MDDSSALVETLKAKAILLIQRERELFDLRDLRRRAEVWIRAFYALSPDLHYATKEDLVERWACLLVSDLNFESAGAFEYDRTDGRVVFAYMDPGPPKSPAAFSDRSLALLHARGSGTCDASSPPELREVADAIGLETFFWISFLSRETTRLLLVTGASPRGAPFHTLAEADRGLFDLLGNYLAALIDNSRLVAQVTRERSELRQANGELDASLRRLRETQEQLMALTQTVADASRRAGMADIATGVLHNVGNVLTSVNVSAEVVSERLLRSRVASLEKVASLLEAEPADERGQHAREFLRELSKHLVAERDELLAEMRSLQGHLMHMHSIVSKQQAYASTVAVTERCSVTHLVEDALSLAEASFARYEVEVVRDYEIVPDAVIDRHKVLQIVVNLVANAQQAVAERQIHPRRVVARVRKAPASRFRIVLEDNGIGIRAEHRSKLFTQGFTTKSGGHGFGLHMSAIAAQELGGELRCESEGHGATFTLELPLHPPAKERHVDP